MHSLREHKNSFIRNKKQLVAQYVPTKTVLLFQRIGKYCPFNAISLFKNLSKLYTITKIFYIMKLLKNKLESENSEIRIDYIATKCLKTKIKVWIYFSQYIPIFIIACLDPVNKTKIAMFIRFLFFKQFLTWGIEFCKNIFGNPKHWINVILNYSSIL